MVLKQVREKDYIVPRLKNDHLMALNTLVKERKVPYIDIKLDRTKNDICYFIDYCHPIAEANKLIANEIVNVIMGKNKKIHSINHSTKPCYVKSKNIDIPISHYTLY